MTLAYRTYEECPEYIRPEGIPLDWPWLVVTVSSSEDHYFYSKNDWILVSEKQFELYKESKQSEYDKWLTSKRVSR
jgi:hypothetical protein